MLGKALHCVDCVLVGVGALTDEELNLPFVALDLDKEVELIA